MSYKMLVACAAFAIVGATTGAANAVADGTVTDCLHTAKQVKAALDANPQSPNYQVASQEKNIGRDYCASGLYDKGVAHYAHALELLGVSKS